MSVSVVMATRNREALLPLAVESVRRQTHTDFELVVVDDGSTDSTPEILRRMAREDDRIVPLRQVHSGVSAARNTALAKCRFPLVAMADDDDLMRPERLALQVAHLARRPEQCAVFSHAHLIDADGVVIGKSAPRVDFDLARRLRRPDLALDAIHGTAMLRKAAIQEAGGYRLAKLEDRDLLGRLWTSGHVAGTIPEFLYAIRRHGANVSRDFAGSTLLLGDFIDHNALRRLDGAPEVSFEAYRAELERAPFPRRVRLTLRQGARFAYDLATLRYSQRRMFAAAGYAMAAFSLSPARTARKVTRKIVWRT